MRRKITGIFLLCVMFSLASYVPAASAENGPEIDLLRYKVSKHPDHELAGMLNGTFDSSIDLLRTTDIETLDTNGFTITSSPGLHIGFVAYNIRDTATIQSYYRPDITYWPLHDAEFRHALLHCWDPLGSVPSYYGYIMTPVHSIVPPAQNKYYSPSVPQHPYNPGNPFTSLAGEHSSVGLLKAEGYVFVDADSSGTVTQADYWKCPNGAPLPRLVIWVPLPDVCGTIYQPMIYEFILDLRAIGLGATPANSNHGITLEGRDFNEYLSCAFGTSTMPGGRFDAYLVYYRLDRLPNQLYTLCHSSQDSRLHWSRQNAPGINDPAIDALVETVLYELDVNTVASAAKQAQENLYDPTLPNADNFALAYMALDSRTYFNAYSPSLTGIVNSYGFSSDNVWTSLNLNWLPGFERIIDSKLATVLPLDAQPESLNPLYAKMYYERSILNRLYDGLVNTNPYNHNDIPWLAADWTITQTETGMDIDFELRNDATWQDGKPFTAYDVEFCLEFMKAHSVPRYYTTWAYLEDVAVTGTNTLTIHCNEEGIGLFYEYASIAGMLPEHIWNRAWPSDQAVLDYDPTEPYNVAPGYTSGPNPPPTNLFGTGPWAFQFYDSANKECDLYANRNYFLTQAEAQTLLTDMFWEAGDYNRDAVINVKDLTSVSFGYGARTGGSRYDPDADFNSDGIIDIRDMGTTAFRLLSQKEYP
jgi:ABC-type transport system substrate-binding protein